MSLSTANSATAQKEKRLPRTRPALLRVYRSPLEVSAEQPAAKQLI